ncbi:hypothetical protein DL89DRAFT_265232 [Linderina pennispora]|uniref:Uncharacterized protein n=1 Tax=Linderina pennispora TaxID=61395 RepID=A0A1Y1WHT3_9FUNG|nr:uncharacterized protein DL89DRAFT_265232 [Linderina pennispora]ORX73079.1 hypothetical protein DL89DRAFT_265232 [Linderina pennispora]
MVLIFINYNRSYTPLKCKNIPLLNLSFLSKWVWCYGLWAMSLQTIPSLTHTSWAICIATISWLRMSLGMFAVVCLLIFRTFEYICIFEYKIRATGRYLWIPLATMATVCLLYGILATVLPEEKGIQYVAVLISLLVVCAVFTYMARDIQSSFNEFRELLATFFVTIIAILVQVILRWVPNISGNEFAYNTLVTLTDFIVCQVNFYFLAYLRFFLKKLRRENNESVYEIANGAQMQRWSTSHDRTDS